MKVATRLNAKTEYNWALEGFVPRDGCDGQVMWCSQGCENQAIYFLPQEVHRDKRRAQAFVRKVQKERERKEEAYWAEREREWKEKRAKGRVPVSFKIPLGDETCEFRTDGKCWRVWTGRTYQMFRERVRSYTYLPKSVTEVDRTPEYVKITIPTWLYEEKKELERFLDDERQDEGKDGL